MCEILDPNTLDFSPPAFHMFAGANADVECAVDEEDYLFFTRWMWCVKVDKRDGKRYFRRAESTYDLMHKREGSITIYLHIEICRRAYGEPPTKRHKIVDHWNGNSLDNRRGNLRWATNKQNNRNRFGSAFYQRELRLCSGS
jgi:hypothetical protein